MTTRKRLAFFAPMKPPSHPAPSGDRTMARALMQIFDSMGYAVELASDLRIFLRTPDDHAEAERLQRAAEAERARLRTAWQSRPPDLWVCYHPYYKSPDLLGPPLCREFGVPWITLEASLSHRRRIGAWTGFQDHVFEAVRGARINICLTERDRAGLLENAPEIAVARLRPFIDLPDPPPPAPRDPNHLITVAMMRPGDKTQSYQILARALAEITDLNWRLTIVGDGPLRGEIEGLFDGLSDRMTWAGQRDGAGVRALLGTASVFVWPGCGEAFGLAYLEAQAMGLPAIALRVAGVPEVIADGESGLLVAPGNSAEDSAHSYAAALRQILTDAPLRRRLSAQARPHVLARHGTDSARDGLTALLSAHVWSGSA